MFRPFKGEIIMGRISSSGEWGIKIRLDFFEDIRVPPHMLFEGSSLYVKFADPMRALAHTRNAAI